MPQHEPQEPRLSPGIAFHLQPDGSWSPENLPHKVLSEAEFSGYLTIQGYRSSVFEMPDGSMWAQKSVNTPATASTKELPSPDMSKKCPECGEEAVDVRAYSACCPAGHFFSVKPSITASASSEWVKPMWTPSDFSKPVNQMDTMASRIAAAWLSRTADRADDVVSQVNEILEGGSDGPFGHDDMQYDDDIAKWCEKVVEKMPEMQEIFETAFHEVMDFKGKMPASENPRVRQIADEKVSEMINQAAARLEIISHGLVAEIQTLCTSLAASAPNTTKEASMKPSQISDTLRRIAAAIDNSKNPDRSLVVSDLKKVLAAVTVETPAEETIAPKN